MLFTYTKEGSLDTYYQMNEPWEYHSQKLEAKFRTKHATLSLQDIWSWYVHQEEADLWVPGDKEKWEWLLKKNEVSVKGNKVFHGRAQR